MILNTKNKVITIVLKTRKIVRIANLLKVKSFENAYFKAIQENDIETLANIILILAEDEDGKQCFRNTEEVEDFIDEYKKENNKTYDDIFKELTEVINKEGFFIKRMKKEEIIEKISNPLSGTDMNELVQKSAENAISKIAEKEFQGYKA